VTKASAKREILGWNALALAGVLMQIIARMRDLLPIVFENEASA
jgi:hypothetical protein